MGRGPIFARVQRARDQQREELLDIGAFCADQQARILLGFGKLDLEKQERRFLDGQWVGRDGLEFEEGRK
jgi:hypothetical protein